jgi:phosphoglycolate phosphatase
MAYDALVFDIDGTLWDTTQPVVRAWNQVAAENTGVPSITTQDIEGVMGLTHEEAFAKLLPGLSAEKKVEAAEKFYDREVKMLHGNYLYKGVAEGIAALAEKFPLYLVSNCQVDYLTRFQTLSGLGHFFKDAECYGNTRKPKGDSLSMLLRRNKISKSAYVGDTAGDQIAARQAGSDFYHVSYGFGSPANDCLGFSDFTQVRDFFLSLV